METTQWDGFEPGSWDLDLRIALLLMLEIILRSQPSASTEYGWQRACGILPLFLALASANAASTPALNVVISQETGVTGDTVQSKLSLDKPAAVYYGELALDLDPTVFGPVTAIATFSAAGDGSSFATVNGSHPDIHFQSASGTLGSAAGMPLLVITVPTLATAKLNGKIGGRSPPRGDPARGITEG